MAPPKKSQHQSSVNDKPIIRLYVGGESFTTLYRTLSKSIFFQNLLKGVMGRTITGDGSVFVDRDGKLFRDVLLYLRTFLIFTNDREKLHSLLLETQFYQIEELEAQLKCLINCITRQEEAQPSIMWKSLGDMRAKLESSTFVLTEKTNNSERSYQILHIIDYGEQPNDNYCHVHDLYSCAHCCGARLVLICRD